MKRDLTINRKMLVVVSALLIISSVAVLASSGWTPQGITEKQTPFKAHTLTITYYTWKQTSGNLASTAGNWENGSAPVSSTSSYVYFTTLSTASCTWDLAINVGAFSMNTGYSGTVTQAASFSVTSYAQAAGTFFGSPTYVLTDSGSATFATITQNVLQLTMTTDGSTITVNDASQFYALVFNANITMNFGQAYALTSQLTIASGKTLTINTAGKIFGVTSKAATTYLFSNSGIIAGAANFYIDLYQNCIVNFGAVTCPVVIQLNSAAPASATASLSSITTLSSTLLLNSNHATYTATLDTTASNYALSATSVTIGTRGILNGRGSTITASGSWDSSAGTFTQGTSSVRLTGASKTLKTTGTSSFNKLFLDAGASYTLQSNVITQQYWKNGTLSLGGYTLYVDQDQAPSITSSPSSTSFACNQQYAYTYAGSDREGETLTYALTTNLSGLTLSAGNSTIWRHGAQHSRGTFTMHLSVTDGNHTVWQNSTLTVTNAIPVFSSSPITSKAFDLDYSYDANATDPEGFSITFGLSSSLGGLTVNSTTGIVSKAHYLGNGTFLVNVSASDGNYTVWQSYSLTILNQVPIVTSRPRMSVLIHDSYSYTPAGYDPEGLSLIINFTTSAPWLTFNPNGTLSGSPLSRDAGSWLVIVSFWDGYRTTYDNYSIEVSILDVSTMSILNLILGLVFGFGFIIFGISDTDKDRKVFWSMFGGFVWISLAVVTFYNFGIQWFIIATGVGLFLLVQGAMLQAAKPAGR